jgi:uncharacterized protein DUF6932
MPIPPLDSSGVLPVGLHDCTLTEIKSRFGSFEGSDRRPHLFAKFESFVAEARSSQIVRSLIIDGSFVTAKLAPNDIDLIVVVVRDHDLTMDLRPVAYNIVSKIRVRNRFGFDIITVREETSEFDNAVAFFEQIRRMSAVRKGLLRIWL